MTTRELIETIRRHASGAPEFNALLLRCADEIEVFMGGPEPEAAEEETE